MIGPFGRPGPAATLRQHRPQMTQRCCKWSWACWLQSRSPTSSRFRTTVNWLASEECDWLSYEPPTSVMSVAGNDPNFTKFGSLPADWPWLPYTRELGDRVTVSVSSAWSNASLHSRCWLEATLFHSTLWFGPWDEIHQGFFFQLFQQFCLDATNHKRVGQLVIWSIVLLGNCIIG